MKVRTSTANTWVCTNTELVCMYGCVPILNECVPVLYGCVLVLYGCVPVLYGTPVLYGCVPVLYGTPVLYGCVPVLYGTPVLYGCVPVLYGTPVLYGCSTDNNPSVYQYCMPIKVANIHSAHHSHHSRVGVLTQLGGQLVLHIPPLLGLLRGHPDVLGLDVLQLLLLLTEPCVGSGHHVAATLVSVGCLHHDGHSAVTSVHLWACHD